MEGGIQMKKVPLGIEHNDLKEKVIQDLVNEFKIALNNVVFGDPAGREYLEHLEDKK